MCHSHHNPKAQGELQDMGMTWARLGCLVLVMDQLGHGERRQHPFRSQDDFAGPFRVGREDYHFRYNTGIQLHLVGESLMGWMVWDLMRGIDLLLARPGIDPARIILLGSVAGGGDPAAVAAVLDERVAAAVPFNFGGPQPETPYPLPPDSEMSFNYAGSGDWESTRNLRLSCRDGFLPWVIVGGIAPRRLVYAHEFSWDQEQDPVWKRLRRIYSDFYSLSDHLDYTEGFGVLRGQPPQASHCNNIGAPHRKRLHQALRRWFGISGGPQEEYSSRRPPEDLLCMTNQVEQELKPQELHTLLRDLERARVTGFRSELRKLKPADRRRRLQSAWQGLLGTTLHTQEPSVVKETRRAKASGLQIEQLTLDVEPGVWLPIVVLKAGKAARRPVVLAVAQHGKRKFLEERNAVIADLLAGGVAVCLPDLRGTGETRVGHSRGRVGEDTSLSATELMLGGTMVGQRLADVRSVLRYLRTRQDLDLTRLAVWGDSFAPINPPDQNLSVPLGVSNGPVLSEPIGGILALLTALFEDEVRAVYACGGLTSFRSVLSSQFLNLPHDVVIPGALTAGDLCDLAAAVAPRPLALYGLVDGLNRRADLAEISAEYEVARQAYEAASATARFSLGSVSDNVLTGEWLLRSVRD
jgi:dienelactone hydrolase